MTFARHALIPAYLTLCLLLGGASAAGYMPNLLLQLIGIAILAWALIVRPRAPMPLPMRPLLILIAGLILLFGIQLLPLPPGLWTQLPGRAPIAQGYRMLQMPLPWLPVSLTASRTAGDLVWLLPPLAVLAGIVRLGAFRSGWLAWAIVGAMAASVLAGALQLVGGEDSPWYFYRVTNFGRAVGFFANSNHTASLFVASIPFVAALQASAVRKGASARKASALLVITTAAFGVIAVGLLLNFSLAGLGLAFPVGTASLLLMLRSRGRKVPGWTLLVMGALAIAAVATIFLGPFNNDLSGKDAKQEISRATSYSRTAPAIIGNLPFGSGLGSFQQVYRTREDPARVTSTYMNRAHSDLVEVLLETGLLGLVLIVGLLAWLTRRTYVLWASDEASDFARAASIAAAALLAHSLVDYPLRTAALAATFAACCALMAEPRPFSPPRTRQASNARHLSVD